MSSADGDRGAKSDEASRREAAAAASRRFPAASPLSDPAFSRIVVHQLKEPLRGIERYVSFLLDDFDEQLGDDARGRLVALQRMAHRAQRELESLRDLCRVEELELNPRPVELGAVVADTVAAIHPRVEETRARVDIAEAWPTLSCDPVIVAEVLQVLLMNALRYCVDAPVVHIEWERPGDDFGGDGIVIRVRDRGIGVRREDEDKIFQPFRRLHPEDRYGGGTGNGLTIARRLVERHGGRIWLERPSEGTGAIFAFSLAALGPGEDEAAR